jgi:hypothetical protein
MDDWQEYWKITPTKARKLIVETSITTIEGNTVIGKVGDYEMVGANGDRYSCDREIFEKTYEKAPSCKSCGRKNVKVWMGFCDCGHRRMD